MAKSENHLHNLGRKKTEFIRTFGAQVLAPPGLNP
jgi:hypothetical protein